MTAHVTPYLAVAVHDVEPGTFRRVAAIRDWLADHGVARVTLLVIPAAGGRPLHERMPLVHWLALQAAGGDAVAQHGLLHEQTVRPRGPARWQVAWKGGRAAEFPGLSTEECDRRVLLGRRLLAAVGLPPRGFVAPAYAYTSGLRAVVAGTHAWSADLLGISLGKSSRIRAPALCLGTSGALKRAASPRVVRMLRPLSGPIVRVDVHPADFDHTGHVSALEALLARTTPCPAVTYDQLWLEARSGSAELRSVR
jgi:predicted deacetylase